MTSQKGDIMYAVFFNDGRPLMRIKEDLGYKVIWEPELYRTKAEATARADELRKEKIALYIDGEECGDIKYEVEVKKI